MLPVIVRHLHKFRYTSEIFNKNDLVFNTFKNYSLSLKWNHLRLCHTCEKNISFLSPLAYVMPSIRCKSTKSIKKHSSKFKPEIDDEDAESLEEFDDYDDQDEEDYIKGKGIELKELTVSSLRIDAILKIGFNISRKTIEKLFYDKKIWINGKLLLKKSANVKIGDEIDIIKSVSEENENLIIVKRIEVLKVEEDEDDNEKAIIKIRRTKSMLVENYQDK